MAAYNVMTPRGIIDWKERISSDPSAPGHRTRRDLQTEIFLGFLRLREDREELSREQLEEIGKQTMEYFNKHFASGNSGF